MKLGNPFKVCLRPQAGFHPALDLMDLAWAYRTSARLLANSLPDIASTSVLPIIYLYRHSLECSIKSILYVHSEQLGVSCAEIKDRKHDLRKQVADLRASANRVGFTLTERTITTVNSIGTADSDGAQFRYEPSVKPYDMPHFITEVESALSQFDELSRQANADAYASIMASILE